MVVLKMFLTENKNTKVVLMSATIDNVLFQYYFAQDHIATFMDARSFFEKRSKAAPGQPFYEEKNWDAGQHYIENLKNLDYLSSKEPCSLVNVSKGQPGSAQHAVKEFFLDSLEEFTGRSASHYWQELDFNLERPMLFFQLMDVALEIIEKIEGNLNPIARMSQKKKGSILVFLPGINEILAFISRFVERFKDANSPQEECVGFEVIMLHSTLQSVETENLFKVTPLGKRKLIVSTNIAESSITVPDVMYVIDFCLLKEIQYDLLQKMERLRTSWASKANCRQRAGRTGRVNDGFVFKLVPKKFYEELNQFQTPELRRCSLDRLILQTKMISEHRGKKALFSDPFILLARAIQPPNLENIKVSINNLLNTGALEIVSGGPVHRAQWGEKGKCSPTRDLAEDGSPENSWCTKIEQDRTSYSMRITDLGKICLNFPIDITMTRFCLVGHIFGCLDECVSMACIQSLQKSIFTVHQKHAIISYVHYWDTMSHYANTQSSDLILQMNLYYDWKARFHPEDPDLQKSWQERIDQERRSKPGQRDAEMPDALADSEGAREEGLEMGSSLRGSSSKHIGVKEWRKYYTSQKATAEEMRWCSERLVDSYTLIELDIMKKEVLYRIFKAGMSFKLFERAPDTSYLKLLIAYSSSYYKYIIKAQIPPYDEQIHKSQRQIQQMNPQIKEQTRIVQIKSQVLTNPEYLKKNSV